MNTIAAAMRLCNGQHVATHQQTQEDRLAATEWHNCNMQERCREVLEQKIAQDEGKVLWDESRIESWADAASSASTSSSWAGISTPKGKCDVSDEHEQKIGAHAQEEKMAWGQRETPPNIEALLLEIKIAFIKRRARAVCERLTEEQLGEARQSEPTRVDLCNNVACMEGDPDTAYTSQASSGLLPQSSITNVVVRMLDAQQIILSFVLLLLVEAIKITLLPLAYVLEQASLFLLSLRRDLDGLAMQIENLWAQGIGSDCCAHGWAVWSPER